MNELAALIGVLLGTGGLASAVSGVLSLQRVRRLQRQLRRLHEASQLFDSTRRELTALDAAKAVTAFDLAASALLRGRALGRLTFAITVLALVGAYAVWIGLGGYSPLVLSPDAYADEPLVGLGTLALMTAEVAWVVRNYLVGDSKARERIVRVLRSAGQAIDHASLIDMLRPELAPVPSQDTANRRPAGSEASTTPPPRPEDD